jgi:protein TIF31
MDGGNEILSDESFNVTAESVAKELRLTAHEVVDGKGNVHTLHTSVDVKGVIGSDSRHYLMDLYRLVPVDIEFIEKVALEKETNPYPHQMVLLRPELIELFYISKARESQLKYLEARKLEGGKELETNEQMPDFTFTETYNPDSFTSYKLGSLAKISNDEMMVREMSKFTSRIISQLVLDIIDKSITMPIDSRNLTSIFHQRGLNMRYLGKVVSLFDQIPHFKVPYFKDLCIEEMLSRSSKIILRKYLKDTPVHLVKYCISHFFNCLFMDQHDSTVVDFSDCLHSFGVIAS